MTIPKTKRLIFALVAMFFSSVTLGTLATKPSDPATGSNVIQHGAASLSQFIDQHPNKLAIVLVSTPGCGFCLLVRQRQLGPLLRDANFADVSVFEIMMADTEQFDPVIRQFESLDGRKFDRLASPRELATGLKIRLAPTVLFLGKGRELAERLIGYGSADFYSAYLEERINAARRLLTDATT